MDKKVTIILLNYCGTEDTLNCIKSLEQIDYNNYEILVVDNASPDNSYKTLKEELKDTPHILLKSPCNDGFAKGNNIGIEYAMKKGTDYILLLNNDTLVDKDFLKELVKCYENHTNPGIVGSKILYEGKRDHIWYGGGDIDFKKFYGYHLGEGHKDEGQYNKERPINFITGCVMLIGKEVIDKIGGLPEEYFMYFEDVDYCIKAKEAGYELYYCPKSIVYHKVSASSGGEESTFGIKWGTRNRIIFMNKFKYKVSKNKYLKAKMYFYSTRIIKLLQFSIKGEFDKNKALKEGIKMGRAVINTK